jgi:hypothetical protein
MKFAPLASGQEPALLKKRLERETQRHEIAESSLKSGKERYGQLNDYGTLVRGTIPFDREKD